MEGTGTMADGQHMAPEQREDELQRVAAMAAAEVVRIIGQVPQIDAKELVASAVMQNDVAAIKTSVEKIEKKLETHYITVDQFEPVRKIVYGVAAIFGVSIVGAIIALILRKP